MLDTLLSRLREEIAIDGTSGSSIDTVWKYAESIANQVAKESNIPTKPKIDGPYKAFIWNYVKQEPELEFFEEVVQSPENQNSDDVQMEEQGAVDQGEVMVPMDEEIVDESEHAVSMKAEPITNDASTVTESAACDDELLAMLQEAQEKDRLNIAKDRKRKSKAAVKNTASKKKKTRTAPKKKPKKKPVKKRKRASDGHSDSDFEMDSESESEFEEDSDFSEVSSEEYSTEDEDVSEGDEYERSDRPKKLPTACKVANISSNPRNVQLQRRTDNANLTAIQDIADLSYDQVQERYGSRLRIIASARLQDEQLFLGVPPDANISPSLLVILKEILKTRTKGLYQASITKLLDIDGRSTGHYVKSLEEKGAITRRGVSINSMFTNICVHARYSIDSNELDMNTVGDKETENELPYNVNGHGKVFSQKALLYAMVDLAMVAPNGLILAQDILHGLGFNSTRRTVRKWFNRSIDELCTKGYFEKGSIKLDGSRQHRCLHLLKTPEDYTSRQQSDEPAIISVDELSFPVKIKTTRNQGIPIHHLLCDVPLESQCLDVITAAGTHGAVQKDVSIALNSDEMRSLSKLLEKLSELKPGQGHEHYGVVRYLEFEGRIRRYRYFTLAASIKVNEGIDYVPPPLPDQETDESKYYERTIFTPMPHTMTEYSRYRKLIKKAGNRNVLYEGKSMPRFTKRKLLNPDGTPRPKSRYILQKEKKIAEMLAAKSAAEARAADPNSTDSTSTSTDNPQADVEIHSFFRSNKGRIREADKHLLHPPSPTLTPAPIISQSRLACPAGCRETRSSVKAAPSKPEDAPAPKRRKRTVAAVAKKDQVAPEATSTTVTRTTRSGRVISSYTVEPVESPTTPDEELPKSQLESEPQSSTQMDISQPSSEPTEPKGDTATEAPTTEAPTTEAPTTEVPTTENHSPATPPIAEKPQPAPKAKRGRPRVLNKVTQPRLKNRSIADFFSRVPKGTTPPVVGTPPVTDTPSVADTPPVASTSATTTKSKTVTFAEPALESQPSSPSAVIDTIQETTVSQPENEATEVTVESTVSKDTTAKEPVIENSTDNDSTVQTDVVDMEVDATNTSQPAEADKDKDNESASATSVTPSSTKPDTETQADVVDMEVDATNTSQPAEADEDKDNESASATSATPSSTKPDTETQASAAKTHHLFRRYQHEKSQKPVNSYLEARIKIFYELLDEMRLIEMGKAFIALFEQRAAAQNKSSKYSMDMRTLWTTALELEKRGQAQTVIVDCPFLSGKTLKRKVVFHRDMSQDSEEFKSYVKFIKERRAINNSNRNLPKPVAEVVQPVVRLSEQVEQMQKEAQELLVSGQIKKAKQMELRISELSKNLETFGRQYCQNMNTYWMIEAVQYGWITARMIRAKVFHKYLYSLLEDNVDGVNQEERVITVNAICDNMSFHLIAQIIGIFKPSKLINDFYKDVNNHKVKLGDMPGDLKRDLVDENTKFLRRLRKLINGLEYIQVLTAQFTEVKDNANFKIVKYAHIAPYYKLEQKVPIIDRKQAHEPVIREHTIMTMDDLNDYWTDLKYVSTFRNAGHKSLKKLDDPNEIELRSSIHSPRNWSTRAIFTRSQRKMLNEKVDKVNRKTPLDNPQELKQIANTLDVPINVIQSYYNKIIDALERRHRYTKEKKLERLLMGGKQRRTARSAKYNIYQGRRVITMDSNHAFVGPRRQPSKANKSYMDDMQDLPVIQDGQKFLKNKAKRKRSSWSEQDDEILLYMYTIMRHRSRQNKVKISWCPAQKVFPDRDPNSTRSRKDRLLGQSSYNEKYELYLIYWDTFYREGIANGDITDLDPEDNVNMDILSYIEYFVQRLQEFKETPVELPLPATLAQAKDMYDIMRSELISPYFEDGFHDGESLVHKLQSLYLVPFTVRKDMEATYDQPDTVAAIEDDAANRLCSVIRVYGLMALMTPAELFDPFHAYQILSRFPQQLMDSVFEQMKTEKILILACGDRPIPGTSWALSAKFMKDMSGELPVDLFNQAKEYERFLTTQTEKFKFLPYHVSSGMMACLLNLLSDNQISFGLSNLNLQMRKVIEFGFRTRGIRDATFSHLGLDIQVNNQADHTMTDASTVRKAYIKQLTNKEYDATLSNLLICLSTKESDMIKAIIHALHDKHEVGLTLYQLKTKLQDYHFTDQDIIMTVRRLCYNKPALVCQVGFKAVRYVHIKFLNDWTINNTETKDYKPSQRVKEEMMSKTNGHFQTDIDRKDIVIPSLWIDINGNVTDLVLNGCKKAIMDLVLRKPGISEADIHRHMSAGLSKREVHDLLGILVEQQALRRIQVQIIPPQQAKQPSIFAKKTVVQCSSSDSIGKLTRSCFWVTTNIFSATV